jgi:CHASE3 domain sensor protein
MSSQVSARDTGQAVSRPVDNLPRARIPSFLRNLKIGNKLTIGFGILVALIFLSAGISYLGSYQATTKINLTENVRVPAAIIATRAQADLLQMLGDVQGYLALGDQDTKYRDSFEQTSESFEADLAELERLLTQNPDPENQRRLEQLKADYAKWSALPEQLFALRDDQLEREPAYELLATEGVRNAGRVLIDTTSLIDALGQSEPSAEKLALLQNLALLRDVAKFEGNFAAMLSALRGYVTTRNRIYRGEYEVNRIDNDNVWERLSDPRTRAKLNPSQRELLDEIAQNREAFLRLPEQMFSTLESDRWREDLYRFRTEAVPLANDMQQLLSELVVSQQTSLRTELASGRQGLVITTWWILAGGVVALIVGLGMVFMSHVTIAGPVRRLTAVAEQIREGDLEARAQVEATDEIGILAETFNNMTSQLRQTLFQVRKEKKRADDLLNVVIPIGVDLSSEKDFNRLLEKMLIEAKQFCRADAGVVYMKEDNRLKFVIVRNDTLKIALGGAESQQITSSRLPLELPVYDDETTPGTQHQSIAAHAATTGETINITDAYQADVVADYGPGVFDEKTDYRSISYLTIPLKNSEGERLGVLQLINAQDPESGQIIPFDPNLQQMMESYSSLAAAALEAYSREQSLKQQIQQLRIEIDEVKRQKQVSEIVDSDFFQDLQAKARLIRSRRSSTTGSGQAPPTDDSER